MHRKKNHLNPLPVHRSRGVRKRITYHSAVERIFDGLADDCGWKTRLLRQAGERAIRTRHHEAKLNHEADRGRNRRPDVYFLSLDAKTHVFYSIELHAVVIRGYAWELDHEPRDDFEGGGYYGDNDWH